MIRRWRQVEDQARRRGRGRDLSGQTQEMVRNPRFGTSMGVCDGFFYWFIDVKSDS